MTRKTDTSLLLGILDAYTSGVTNSLATVCAMNGVSFSSVYQWLRDDTLTLPEYMGEKDIPFGKALNLARNVSKALTISRSLEEFVLNGRKVQVWHHGEPSYVDDEAAVTATKEEFEDGIALGYFWPDRKKRILNPETGVWERVIMMRVEPAPAQLIERYASANMPAVYGAKSEVTMKGNVSLGVTVVAGASQRPIPPEVLAQLSPPVTETTLQVTDGTEVYEADDGLDDLLGPDPVPIVPTTGTPLPVFDPEPAAALPPLPVEPVVIREPTPAQYAPTVNPILAPGPKAIPPGWRQEWDRLQALPDKINRRA